MRNKLLRLIKDGIPYIKELRPHTKSIASTVLMQQLDYWFEPYPDKFYKFMTKPDTPINGYKDGDSWEEELGISVDEFRTAFDNIGVRYKSKTEYDAAPDKFQGKFYCSYFDRLSRKTWYFRNHELVDSILDGLTSIKTKKQIRQEKRNLSEVDDPNFGKLATPIPRSGQPQFLEVDDPNLYKLATPISNLYTEITTENKTEITTEKNKEADFVFSEIRDLKDEALDENINSTANAKDQEAPIPPTPLSQPPAAPEKIAKPLPPDPMGDRFKSGKKSTEWTRTLAAKAGTEWHEVLEPWADLQGLKPNFKPSLIEVTKQHLKANNKDHDFLDAQTCLVNYVKNDKVSDFQKLASRAEGVEEADRRLEAMQITKPECTTTYWYLWQPVGKVGDKIIWDRSPQTTDAPVQEQMDLQDAVIREFLGKLQAKGLIQLAIANKHILKKDSNVSRIFFQGEIIQGHGIYLQRLAQQLQGAIAA